MNAPCIFFLLLLLGGITFASPVLGLVGAAIVIAIVLRNAIASHRDRARAESRRNTSCLISAYFVENGQIITISKGNIIRMLDAQTGLVEQTFRRDPDWIDAVAFSADGHYVVWAVEDPDGEGTSLCFGESLSPMAIHEVGSGDYISRLVISPDGNFFGYIGQHGKIELWAAKTGSPVPMLFEPLGELLSLDFSPDGNVAFAFDNTVLLCQLPSGGLLRTFEYTEPISSVIFSSDGQYMAVAGESGIRIWNYAAGTLTRNLKVRSATRQAVFSPESQYLACDEVSGVSLWDVERGLCLWNRHPGNGWVECLSISPDSRQLIGLGDRGRLYLWRLDGDGRLTSTQILSEKGWVTGPER